MKSTILLGGAMLAITLFLFLVAQNATAQTLATDQADYPPGSIVTLTGTGFSSGETVTLQVLHDEVDGDNDSSDAHDPWDVSADNDGNFVTTWVVPADQDELDATLLATADGQTSGLHAEASFTDGTPNGTGVVTVTANNGSCLGYTSAVGAGPDNWEVAEGGSYTVTVTGVTECSGDAITIFVQNSDNGNFCFTATGGNGTYVGSFTMPNPSCNTSPISYKCGGNQPCNNSNTYNANGPSNNHKVHLRASKFDASCNKTGDDTNCTLCNVAVDEIHVNVSANGGNDGSIEITVTGGVGPFTYLWNDGNTDKDRTGLAAGTYSVLVTDSKGCTQTKEIVITEPACQCEPPSNISITAVENDQVQVCWNAQNCARGYILQYQWKGHSNWLTVNITAPDHCTNIDLKGHTNIFIKIATTCSDGSTTEYTSNISYRYVAPCTPPSNMYTTNITATTATLHWTPGTATSSQKVRYHIAKQSASIVKAVSTTASSLTISGLTPSTTYNWKAKGDCWSGEIQFTTAAQKMDVLSGIETELLQMSVYPNPATDRLNVDITAIDANDHAATIQLVNMMGQIVLSENDVVSGGNSLHTIALNNDMSSGIYLLRVICGDQTIEKRVVISTNR